MSDSIVLDKHIDNCNPDPDIRDVLRVVRPAWDDVQIQPLSGTGLVNCLRLCWDGSTSKAEAGLQGEKVIVRIDSPENRLPFVRRDYEFSVYKSLSQTDVGVTLVARFQNGLVYTYAEGCEVTPELMGREKVRRAIIDKLHLLHTAATGLVPCQPGASHVRSRPFWLDALPTFWNWIPEDVTIPDQDLQQLYMPQYPARPVLAGEVSACERLLGDLADRYPAVFCHQDAHISNMVWDENTGAVSLVDWECAGYSVEPLELAKVVDQWAGLQPDREFRRLWVREYLERNPARTTGVRDREVEHFYRDLIRASTAFKIAYVLYGLYNGYRCEKKQDREMFLKLGIDMWKQYQVLKEEMESFQHDQ